MRRSRTRENQPTSREQRITRALERSNRRRRGRVITLGMLGPENTSESNPDAPDPDVGRDEAEEMAVNAIFNVSDLARGTGAPLAMQQNIEEGRLIAETSQNIRQEAIEIGADGRRYITRPLPPTQLVEIIEIINSPPRADDVVEIPGSANAASTTTQSAQIAATSANSEQNLNTPSPPKKRKRNGSGTPKTKNTPKLKDANSDDDENDPDNGLTCPICFDTWEMTGEHRLVSLRCGHLFGESCIRRWLAECARQSGVKMCPQCKTKAMPRDIRHLFAKRVRAIDRTEEHELRQCLDKDRKKLKNIEMELDTMKITYAVAVKKIQDQELEIERLKNSIRLRTNMLLPDVEVEDDGGPLPTKVYKLFMEQSIVLPRDGSCRVMAYTRKHSSLLVSQKSSNTLFPGFGVRFIDVHTFRAMQFKHLTTNIMRDISISADQQLMACTSMEPSVKLYDFRTRTTSALMAPNNDKKLWACAMGDAGRDSYLYAGGQQGSIFVFDTRSPNQVLAEYGVGTGDLSPVISIAIIPKSDDFPFGGFCICKLQSIWFHEYNADDEITQTRLNIEGPFISMNYVASQSLLIVTARITLPEPESRYLVGKLSKIEHRPHFELTTTLLGSKTTPVMMRSSYVSIDTSSLFTSYIQDTKQLAVFDIRRKCKIQSLPIHDIVYDTCPVYTTQGTYVAALSESKCRIYKLNESMPSFQHLNSRSKLNQEQ